MMAVGAVLRFVRLGAQTIQRFWHIQYCFADFKMRGQILQCE